MNPVLHNKQNQSDRAPGLYVHVPFCRSKCPYCAFYSVASSSLIPTWLGAFKKEVLLNRGLFKAFDSLYIGGGTPSFLGAGILTEIFKHLDDHFDFAPEPEVTIEANPSDVNREKITLLKDLGVNRISLGVQSFNDRVLTFLGRGHSGTDAERAITFLRSSGFDNIGLDLIYGFQGQTLKDWIRTLQNALAFRPDHLSCYQLTIERGTRFREKEKTGFIRRFDEDLESDFFLTTSRFLEDQGYIHYEISNFAREPEAFSRHNSKYWDHSAYLGLGPSAHSYQKTTRWWNVRSLRTYCEWLEEGRKPIEGHERLTPDQLRLETVALGLRTRKGIPKGVISNRHYSVERLKTLEDEGFLHVKGKQLLPTRKGFLVADSLPGYLLGC